MKKLKTGLDLADKITKYYNEHNLEMAWKYWCDLFDLFTCSESALDHDLKVNSSLLLFITSTFSDQLVYDVTDYGKRIANL